MELERRFYVYINKNVYSERRLHYEKIQLSNFSICAYLIFSGV